MKKKLFSCLFSAVIFSSASLALGNMSAPFPISSEPDKMEFALSLATDGTKYLVPVMTIPQLDSWSLHAQFIFNNGSQGIRVPIVENSLNIISDAKVAFGEGKFLVIWTETEPQYNSVKGIFINSNGVKGTIFTIASGIPSNWETVADIAFGSGKFLIAYEKPYTYNGETHTAIYGKFVDPNGNISNEFKISALWGGFNLNQIAFDGTNFLVVYRDDREDTKVLARFVSPSGVLGSELVIDNNNLPSDNPFSLFFDGEKYFIVWTDQVQSYPNIWQFYGKFVYPNGTQTQPFTITHVNSLKVAPSIAYDGAKYLISWNDGRMCGFLPDESISCIRSGLDIYGRYYSKNGVPLGGEFLVSGLSGNEVGGIMGKALGGKVLGIINKNIDFSIFSAGDVDGRFWISSGYDIFAPENREKLMAGSPYTIRWRTPPQAVKFNIYYSNDNGQTWNLIKSGHTSKTFTWTVPAQDGRKPNCKIRIDAYDSSNNKLTTFYSRVFSIEVAKLVQPNGGELLTSGQTYTIKWQTQGLNAEVAKVTLQYSFDGKTWTNIKTVNGNPGQTNWIVPTVNEFKPTTMVRLIFRDANGRILGINESEAVFTIEPTVY
ncbi:MAG: discoidin domain-containing protein [Ignisphaera sp.]